MTTTASMGPRLISRGNSGSARLSRSMPRSFNGAAADQPRKCLGSQPLGQPKLMISVARGPCPVGLLERMLVTLLSQCLIPHRVTIARGPGDFCATGPLAMPRWPKAPSNDRPLLSDGMVDRAGLPFNRGTPAIQTITATRRGISTRGSPQNSMH